MAASVPYKGRLRRGTRVAVSFEGIIDDPCTSVGGNSDVIGFRVLIDGEKWYTALPLSVVQEEN